MTIGIFSDSYLPSLDGVCYSIESFRKELEKRGHTVYIFAPAPGIRYKEKSPNITRFPAVKGIFYDDQLTSLYFPPEAMQRIKKKQLDVVHFQTPGQVGLLGAYYALRHRIPLISTYHTDLYEYVTHYPHVLPGTIALSLLAPFITRGGLDDLRTMISSIRPERSLDKWNKKMVVKGITMLHNHCDYVIAPSQKIERQLRSWGTTAPIRILPTGVDKITTTHQAVTAFRTRYGIAQTDKVVLYVGRLGPEKNLELLLSAFKLVLKDEDNAKLVMVGRHEHQKALESMAVSLGIAGRTVFTGFIEHDKLGAAYESAHVFAFPSRTDTQSLALNEAARACLPIVMADREISQVMREGENGLFARSTPRDFSRKLLQLLQDDDSRRTMGKAGASLAAKFSAGAQTGQLERLYNSAIEARRRAAILPE